MLALCEAIKSVTQSIGKMTGTWEPVPGPTVKVGDGDDETIEVVELGSLGEVKEVEEELIEEKPQMTVELMIMMMVLAYAANHQQDPLGEDEILDLCPIQENDMDVDEAPGAGWRRIDVTVDSGAANSVINGDDFPNVPREESEGSKKGLVYQGPGSERIANRGQKRFKVRPQDQSSVRNMTFQDAKVRKPLAAVSGITEKNNIVLLDKKGSFIALASCPEVAEIRRLIMQIKSKIELQEKRGVYLMPIWIEDRSSGFTRRGE
jgi:hypothetical protein